MSETIKKLIPVTEVNSPYFCIWLQEMAEQGLIYKEKNFCTVEFEKSNPEKRRYRLLNKPIYRIKGEEREIYEESGWKLMSVGYNSLSLATTNNPDAEELFNDIRSYKKSIRRKWIGYAFAIVVWLWWIYHIYSDTMSGLIGEDDYAAEYGKLHSLDSEPVAINVILAVLSLLCIFMFVMAIVRDLRTIRVFFGSSMPNYEIPYDDRGYIREKKLNNAVYALAVVMLAGIVCAGGLYASIGSGLSDGAAALQYENSRPVRLAEIDRKSWDKIRPLIENSVSEDANTNIDIDYMAGDDNSRYFRNAAREQLQTGRIDEEDNYVAEFYFYSYYGEAKDADLAAAYLAEEASHDLNGKVPEGEVIKVLDEINISCDDVDYAGYYESEMPYSDGKYKVQKLILRKGGKIEIVEYYGPENLKDKLDIIVEKIK